MSTALLARSPQTTRPGIIPPPASRAIYFGACTVLLLCILAILLAHTSDYRLFGTYWESGHAAAHGLNPYAAYPHTFRFHPTPGDPRLFTDLNLSPPCVLPLLQILSHLSIDHFRVVASLASWFLFALTAGLLLWHHPSMQKRQILWLLLSVAVCDTLTLGQIYAIFFLLAALAWISLSMHREWTAAIAIGLLLAMRPTLLFWPVFLYCAGQHRLARRAMAVACIASAYPVLLYGTGVYREWVAALAHDAHGAIAANIAIIPFFSRVGLSSLGVVLAVALATALAWFCSKRKLDAESASALALGAWLLCSPLSWINYTLIAAPWFIARRWTVLANIAAALLAIPMIIPARLSSGSTLHMVIGSGIYFIPVWLILWTFFNQSVCRNQSDSR
ncbi:MAG TPA: glycosyltransferase family 87 protein [Acidobacteriaceae bacterium]|jgi:hypothetical protein|nr:glycosyltransferase family 87 protein [Acidobacteriaceae bacterium]